MGRLLSVAVSLMLPLFAATVVCGQAATPASYSGTIDRLLPDVTRRFVLHLQPAAPDQSARIVALVPRTVESMVGTIALAHRDVVVAITADASGLLDLLADVDGDNQWTAAERFPFRDPERQDELDAGYVAARFALPLKHERFRHYPVVVAASRRTGSFSSLERPRLSHTFRVVAAGTVTIDGKAFEVRYGSVDVQTGAVDPTKGLVQVDCDGDGVVRGDWWSAESAKAQGTSPVFRVGQRYLSTSRVDGSTGEVRMEVRQASDYHRIELAVGQPLTDFSFVDFSGATRRLSDYRGRIVLLDFWGTWCGPCLLEFPHLKDIHARFHAKGFEILGLDRETWEGEPQAAIEKSRALIAEQALPWINVRPDSAKGLIDRFQVVAYPTHILLDRHGVVLSWGQDDQLPLHGPELATTLEKLLGRGEEKRGSR